MSKINALPRGLQEFLGNTSQGINPSDLSQVVVPGFDMYPFWAADKIQMVQDGPNRAGTVGQATTIQVPEGEVWQVIAFSGNFFVVSEQSLGMSLRILDPSGGLLTIVAQNDVRSAPITMELTVGVALPDRFLLRAGFGLTVQIDMATDATARSLELHALVVKMKA